MSKRKQLDRRKSNPDFRARHNVPLPPVEEIQRRIGKSLTPNSFAAARLKMKELKLRERLLTLPVMVCFVLSLVWRQIPSLSELLRILEREGLFDLEPMRVTKQALSQRLESLPAELFVSVFNEALAQVQEQAVAEVPVANGLERVRQTFPACYVADGSTLEALRKQLNQLKQGEATAVGGKMLGLIDLYTRRAVRAWYSEHEKSNDKRFSQQIIEFLTPGSLTVFDTGFFSFPLFDQLTDEKKSFVTRFRQQTAYHVVQVLSQGPFHRDEIIQVGLYRSNPCRHRLRLVSVLWGQTWYRYVTNVLDQQTLTARDVCELYRHRWRIEEAFLLTKRLLGLSYFWSATRNAVQIQVYATWLFYAVLTSVCADVAQALNQPVERISTEMVFRSFYHFHRAIEMGEDPVLIPFLTHHAQLFGLVKAQRKRHREKQKLNQLIWAGLT
jgi:hypothetical protein